MRQVKNNALAGKGRNGDTHLAHVAKGEIIVPPVISDETRQRLVAEMEAAGIDAHGHTVGEGMSINPDTGLPEFGFFKKVGKSIGKAVKSVSHAGKSVLGSKLGSIAAPIGLSLLAPGLGTALGGALGATGAGASALGSGLIGAGLGGVTGGLKGAALGGITGGAGGYLSGGGLSGKSVFGPATSTQLGSAGGNTNAALGSLGSKGGLFGLSGVGGGGSSYGSLLSPLASTALGSYSNSKATSQLTDAQKKARGLYDQYANEEYTPGDLSQSPGYQFQLQQGQQALDRKNAATGGYYSGAALKDAAGFAQGLADTTAQEQYQNWLSTQAQRLSAVGQQAGLTTDIGASKATGTLNQGQLLGQGASGVLGGLTGKYYNPATGTFYDPQNSDLISQLLAKNKGVL